MKTDAESEALKENWNNDPCWDLEETEGFEEHSADLLLHKVKMRSFWSAEKIKREQERNAQIKEVALSLGIPDNTALASRVMWLDDKVEELENKNNELSHKVDWLEKKVNELEDILRHQVSLLQRQIEN